MAMAPPYGLALNVTSTRRCPLREFDLGRLDGNSRSSQERAAGIGRAIVNTGSVNSLVAEPFLGVHDRQRLRNRRGHDRTPRMLATGLMSGR